MKSFKELMIEKHTHAEIQNDINPSLIVYKEEDVLELMRIVRDRTLEWAAENAESDISYGGEYFSACIIDEESILKGKTHKDLEI